MKSCDFDDWVWLIAGVDVVYERGETRDDKRGVINNHNHGYIVVKIPT